MKKGFEYTFVNETGDSLALLNPTTSTVVTNGVTIMPNGDIKWIIPTDNTIASGSLIWLIGALEPDTAVVPLRII